MDPEEANYVLVVYRFADRRMRKVAGLSWQPPRPLAFSPDGRFLAVVDGNQVTQKHRIVLVDLKGGPGKVVAEDAAVWDGPGFTGPGFLAVATALDRQYTNRLFLLNVANAKERKLHVSSRLSESKSAGRERSADNPAPLSVAPGRKEILWLDWGRKHPEKRQLVLVGMTQASVRYVTDDPGGCLGARFSPDGRKIAYAAPAPTQGKTGIYVAGARGGRPEKVTEFVRQPYRGWMFSWSPDAKSIVFTGKERGGTLTPRELWRVDVETKETKRLTNNEVCECYPEWVER
jgi:Tol biopolymer transport system component